MKLIMLSILTIGFSGFSQDVNKLDAKGLKDGVWKGTYEESKRPRYEGTFEHGKEIGTFKFFDDTKVGTVIASREFNPKDNSCYTIFYNQKKSKVSEGKVINKLYVGEWKYYHENSDTIMTKELYVNGKLSGIRKVYYPNGKIAEETTYKNGSKEGLYKRYGLNGVILEESNYKNNIYNGLATFKNQEGKIVGQGQFKDDEKVGIWDIMEKDVMIKKKMGIQDRKIQKRTKPILQEYNR